MKSIFFLFTLFVFQLNVCSQTAEEILWDTEHAYRKLTNYVDEGTSVRAYVNYPYPDTTRYHIALDRNGNVNQWFLKEKKGKITGAKYVKSAKDTIGTYTRFWIGGESITCNMPEAAARLGGSGGGVLFMMIGSLLFADFTSMPPGDSSMIQYYDTATRLDDTMISDVNCYVIKTEKTLVIPKEVADKQNFQRDSTQGLLDLPPEHRGGPRVEAGPLKSERKYYIRTSDLMIIRIEETNYKPNSNILQLKSTLALNPRYDVKDFETYLRE